MFLTSESHMSQHQSYQNPPFQSLTFTLTSPPLPLVSFPHLLKQIEKDSFQLIYFTHSLHLHLTLFLFLPTPQSLFCTKKKKNSTNKRWHGLLGKTNENDHFQLPTNNILLSQRSRSIFSHLQQNIVGKKLTNPLNQAVWPRFEQFPTKMDISNFVCFRKQIGGWFLVNLDSLDNSFWFYTRITTKWYLELMFTAQDLFPLEIMFSESWI